MHTEWKGSEPAAARRFEATLSPVGIVLALFGGKDQMQRFTALDEVPSGAAPVSSVPVMRRRQTA